MLSAPKMPAHAGESTAKRRFAIPWPRAPLSLCLAMVMRLAVGSGLRSEGGERGAKREVTASLFVAVRLRLSLRLRP